MSPPSGPTGPWSSRPNSPRRAAAPAPRSSPPHPATPPPPPPTPPPLSPSPSASPAATSRSSATPPLAGGRCCFYAQTPRAERVVVLAAAGEPRIIAKGAGALGPTMNSVGVCAFRVLSPGGEAICRAGPDAAGYEQLAAVCQELDSADGRVRIRAFQGLPVINESGCVSCCADLDPAGRAIVLWRPSGPRIVAHTGARFTWLGPFPMLDDAGRVVFAATEQTASGDARSGIYLAHRGAIECLVSSPPDGPFESFRGSLIDGHRRVVYFATPAQRHARHLRRTTPHHRPPPRPRRRVPRLHHHRVRPQPGLDQSGGRYRGAGRARGWPGSHRERRARIRSAVTPDLTPPPSPTSPPTQAAAL
jgi:hypothetical protein